MIIIGQAILWALVGVALTLIFWAEPMHPLLWMALGGMIGLVSFYLYILSLFSRSGGAR
jgi:hypothetical protein